MAVSQKALFCIVFAALLAVAMGAAAAFAESEDQHAAQSRIHKRSLANIWALLNGRISALLKSFASIKTMRKRQTVTASLGTCEPACSTGQCCRHSSTSEQATCHSLVLSGKECGWTHYTAVNPSNTTAIVGNFCPCTLGSFCFAVTSTNTFVCGGFK